MVASAWGGAEDADIVLVLVEANRGVTAGVQAMIDGLGDHMPGTRQVVLVINKIDRVKRERLLALAADLNQRRDFTETFMISAEKGDGVADLRRWLAANLPKGPWHYPEDQIADAPLRSIAAEITREKLTLRLHQELPYQMTVETESWEDKQDGSARIAQIIYVAREGHKGIVLGRKGETIRQIGADARADIARLLGRPVHLFLTVKFRPGWLDEPERYREMGLDFSDGG
jgi:GTP-binding protein Era